VIQFKDDYTSFQEGATRFQKAMQGVPDRVPVYAQMHEFAMAQVNASAIEFYTTPELLTPATLEIAERFGIDVGIIDYDCYNIEAEALGQRIVWSDDHMPDVDRGAPLITSPGDLHKIRTPDFDIEGRFVMIVEMHALFEKLTGLPSSLGFAAPFSLAANIRGIENLIMDIMLNPSFARGLFDAIVDEVLAPWILYQKKHLPSATSISGSDATASPPILNLKLLEEWVVPYILRLREICGPEVHVPNWVGEQTLKEPEELLDLKLQVSPRFLEGQDPDVAALGPAFFKDYATARNVPLVLGVGAAFLASSTPAEIRQRVKNYVEIGGKDGQLAIYLCNLGATTPPENVRAAIEAVRTYGTYD
jgi:uroporphyrinogen decarboxylase